MVASPLGMAIAWLFYAKSVVSSVVCRFGLCYVQIFVSVVCSFSVCHVQCLVPIQLLVVCAQITVGGVCADLGNCDGTRNAGQSDSGRGSNRHCTLLGHAN